MHKLNEIGNSKTVTFPAKHSDVIQLLKVPVLNFTKPTKSKS